MCGKCKKYIDDVNYYHCTSCPKDKYICSRGHVLALNHSQIPANNECKRCRKQIDYKSEYYSCRHNNYDVEAYHKDCVG
jgi:hypothetical protein